MLRTVSILFINSELVVEICSGNNNTLLLYTYEVTHLVNKGVTRPYVQEEARVL